MEWARDHDLLWRAILALRKEKPGTKLNLMRTQHSPAYMVYQKYSLQSFERDIENGRAIGDMMKDIWRAMTGKHPSYLFKARKAAGLPSLRAPKRTRAAKA